MSEQEAVTTSEPPPAEIIPAKSEDKLEIEKEEAEKKDQEEEKKEDKEEKKESEEKEEKEAEAEEQEKKEETSEKEDKKFKLPKVPGFLRSKSKEREKNKDKAAEEGEAEAGAGEENEEEKDAKTKVKEALENIHLPKMPKIHKPAFLKKKKSDEGAAAEGEEGGDEAKEDGEQDNKDADEEQEGQAEGTEAKAEGGEDKPPGFFYNIKVMKKDFSSFLSKKSGSKEKDPEAAGEAKDEEESKELLEKKDEEAADGDEKKDDAEENAGDKKEQDQQPSKATAFLDSLRNVASQVPSLFKKTEKKSEDADVEAGEKDELLEEGKEEKKEEGDLEEVKVVPEGGEAEEKKDPEKAEPAYTKYLNQLKEGKNVCQQKYEALDRSKQLGVLAVLAALFLFLFILIIVGICAPSNWTNYSRITQDGKYVVTHTTCGPIQGLVEGHDQFSFKRIPYAVPVLNTDRWTHSRPMTTLTDCHEGTLIAHSHNATGSCWRRYPNGADGDEDCLTLDIYTASVVYNDLKPVIVYVDGDDLSQDEEEALQPSASLASKTDSVFVSVNYRRGVLGFLSLQSLSDRSNTKSSGNYGLGDLVSALQWIKKNIQHFGGHPGKVTILARGSGATFVTALTASPLAQDLFHQAWVTNGAGSFENKTLSQASAENKEIVAALNCGSDEAECLIDATAEDLTDKMPFEWRDTNQPELPQKGEKGHSWIIIDKHLLRQHPKDYWSGNQLSNNIPMVFGATAQGEVTKDTKEFLDWTNTNEYEAHIEEKLGSFNTSIPGQAMSLYNVSDHWQEYASMISDIRTVCPIQELAAYVSENFVSDVFSYVATQKRSSVLGGIADKTSDIAAIFGTYETEDEAELKFVNNMKEMFFTFVKTGKLPLDKDLTTGMYIINDEITTRHSYPNCDFWKEAQKIVPTYAALD